MVHTTHASENISHRASGNSVIVIILLVIWAVTIIMGQLVRLPLFGQSGGLLPSDIANVLVITYAAYLHAAGENKARWAFLAIVPFLLWSLFVLLLHWSDLSSSAMIVSLSYWVRLTTILGLLPVFCIIFAHKNNTNVIRPSILFLVSTMVILGYVQLLVYPSLQNISGGWDPHRFRMVATWLDPNFFGAFLAMTLPYAVCLLLRPARVVPASEPESKQRGSRVKPRMTWVFSIFILLDILLTRSRSTFVAMFIAATICGILFLLKVRVVPAVKKLASLGAVFIFLCIALAVVLLGNRATNVFIHDPTVSMRLEAYQVVWRKLVEPNSIIGVGYNSYQFAAKNAGIISNFNIHSRAGSDNSIFTLLVTTGVFGTALFLAPMLIAATFHIRRFLQTQQVYSLCFIWATIVLLIHSQFTSSLLYPHLLMTYIFLAVTSLVYE